MKKQGKRKKHSVNGLGSYEVPLLLFTGERHLQSKKKGGTV